MKSQPKSKLHEFQNKAKDGVCTKCGQTRFLTVDHIIPVSWIVALCLKELAYEMEDNFQILCK